MSHRALKTWLHCLKIPMAINNPSLWSWSFPRMPQDNSFPSFSLDNKSSSWSVISGQRSCPHRQTEPSCRNNSDGWPLSSAAWIVTCSTCWIYSHQSRAFTALTISLAPGRWWFHGSEMGEICPKALNSSKQRSCTVWPPGSAPLGWGIQMGNSDWFWRPKLFISPLQAHSVTTVA